MSENYLDLIPNKDLYEEFINKFGDRIPNPKQYPKQYEFLVKSFLFSKENEND